MNLQNLLTATHIRQAHNNLAVKPAWPQQGRVQHVGTVGRGNDNHALVPFKAVHFDQQLVECLLAFVMPAAQSRTAMPTHGVDFINKDDARRVFLGLLKHIPNPRCADPDEHFDEIRTGYGEKRHFGLAGNGAGQQGFAGSRRADHQRTARDFAA